jgi:hypothetical protein
LPASYRKDQGLGWHHGSAVWRVFDGLWFRVFAGLILVAVASYFLSNALLDGPDPRGWWNYVPALTFYISVFLIPALALSLAITYVIVLPLGRLLSRWR